MKSILKLNKVDTYTYVLDTLIDFSYFMCFDSQKKKKKKIGTNI